MSNNPTEFIYTTSSTKPTGYANPFETTTTTSSTTPNKSLYTTYETITIPQFTTAYTPGVEYRYATTDNLQQKPNTTVVDDKTKSSGISKSTIEPIASNKTYTYDTTPSYTYTTATPTYYAATPVQSRGETAKSSGVHHVTTTQPTTASPTTTTYAQPQYYTEVVQVQAKPQYVEYKPQYQPQYSSQVFEYQVPVKTEVVEVRPSQITYVQPQVKAEPVKSSGIIHQPVATTQNTYVQAPIAYTPYEYKPYTFTAPVQTEVIEVKQPVATTQYQVPVKHEFVEAKKSAAPGQHVASPVKTEYVEVQKPTPTYIYNAPVRTEYVEVKQPVQTYVYATPKTEVIEVKPQMETFVYNPQVVDVKGPVKTEYVEVKKSAAPTYHYAPAVKTENVEVKEAIPTYTYSQPITYTYTPTYSHPMVSHEVSKSAAIPRASAATTVSYTPVEYKPATTYSYVPTTTYTTYTPVPTTTTATIAPKTQSHEGAKSAGAPRTTPTTTTTTVPADYDAFKAPAFTPSTYSYTTTTPAYPTYSYPQSSYPTTNYGFTTYTAPTTNYTTSYKPTTVTTTAPTTTTVAANVETPVTTTTVAKPAAKDGDHKSQAYQVVKIKNDYGDIKEAKEFVDDPNSKFNQLWKQLKAANRKFDDTEFPPNSRSLGNSDTFNAQDIVWCRPDEYYGKGKYMLYEGSISVDDIKQGSLGDCYFLCTLAALAEWPHRIEKLFVNKEANEQGIYSIRINDMGEWHEIIVDDQLPCWADDKSLAFAKGNNCELWVCLLEKAWAKLFGSYARIEAGDTREALHDLTGAPTKYFYLADLDEEGKEHLWHELLHGEKNDFVMTCSSPCADGLSDQDDRDGIFYGHAYSLLSAHEAKHQGRQLRLLRIRNPHSHGEWTGAWSDHSPLWTQELKQQVQWRDEDDGTFYMSWEDFFEYYEDCQICKVHDDYHYTSLKIDASRPNENVYFKLTIPKDGKYYITVNQENKRHHDEMEQYQHSPVYMLLAKPKGATFEEVEQKNETGREVWSDGHITAGEIFAYVQADWFDGQAHPFVISAYGPEDVSIKKITEADYPKFIEFSKKYQ